jgi:hypothetical protein
MQTQDLEELSQPRKKHRKKTEAEAIEIIIPQSFLENSLSYK